jgi:alkylation response protein AidB-like acyl-CoA dehydrogenase
MDERSEVARLLRENASAFLGDDLSRIRKLRFSTTGFDRSVWSEMCALGWLAVRIPEEHGGAGLGMQEYCALAVELGRSLAPEPLILASMAARCLEGTYLEEALKGEHVVLPTWQERGVSYGESARAVFDDERVSGEKLSVSYARSADAFVVTTSVGPVLVEAAAPGLSIDSADAVDGGHIARLRFDHVPARRLQSPDFQTALSDATLATAAYLAGVAGRAFEITLDYLKIRSQFGKPIGTFQVLQHRAVELYLDLALMQASCESAARTIDSLGVAHRAAQSAVSRARARASRSASKICRTAIQLHGAIGYTDEADIGLFLRKTMALLNQFGSEREHRARFLSLNSSKAHENTPAVGAAI